MVFDLLSRILFALLLVGAGIVLYRLASRVLLTRMREKRLGLESLQAGVPAILYFSSPDCMPCKTVQRPELKKLVEKIGDRVQIIEINAKARPDLADYWGILSLPTTFIIDSHGQPRHINHGVTRADQLIDQIQTFDQHQHVI